MNNLSKIKKELIRFGLSEIQAKIYLLLVKNKELRIQEIVSLSKIPRTSVYENLKKLYELGIAEEITDHHFKKIRPYSIGAMRHGLDEKMFEIKRLVGDLGKLEKRIGLTGLNTELDSTELRFYKGRSGARQIYWNSLNANDTVYFLSDWGAARYVGMNFYENYALEWKLRDKKEKVLINLTPDKLESIRKYNNPRASISKTKVDDIRIVDEKKLSIKGHAFIYNNIYAQVNLKSIGIDGFEIESSQFTNMQRSFFESIWDLATPVINFL